MTTITIGSNVVPNWHGGSSVQLRIFLDREVITSDDRTLQPGSPDSGAVYQTVTCSVSGTNLTIAPSPTVLTIDSTRDAKRGSSARYSAYFYNPTTGAVIEAYHGFSSFVIYETYSAGTSTTWSEIYTTSNPTAPRPIDLSTLSTQEILERISAAIDAIFPGGTATLAVGGTGSNLSATGPGFLFQASNGANVTIQNLTAKTVSSGTAINFTQLRFDQASGFTVTESSTNVVDISMTTMPIANTTGTLQPPRGGTGATAVPTDGQILVGNTAMGIFAVATLGVGNSLARTAGAGTLSLNTIQDIRTSDTPTFAGLITSGQEAFRVGPYNTGAGQTGEIRLRELVANGTNYTGFKAGDAMNFTGTGNMIYILPVDNPAANDVLTAATPSGGFCQLEWAPAAGAGTGYVTIQEEGTPLTSRTVLNFIGAAITATDTGAKTNITLSQSPASASVVGTGRLVSTSTGLTGGGALTGDLTLSVVDDSTTQKVRVSKGGSLVGTRQEINFIEGTGITLTTADVGGGTNRVNVTITATGGASGTVSGSGTAGRIAKWSSASALTDSLFSEDTNVVNINNSGGAVSALRFFDADGSNYVGLASPNAVTGSVTFKLPGADGTAGQYIKTDAAGNLSFDSAVRSLALTSADDADITLAGTLNLTLNIPSHTTNQRGVLTPLAQIISGAKTFDSNIKVSKTFPQLLLEDTGGTKHLAITSVGNAYDLKDVNDASGSLIYLDLVNNRMGLGKTAPGSLLDVKGVLRLSGTSSGFVGLQGASAAGSTVFTLPSADGAASAYMQTNGSGVLSLVSAYGIVQDNGAAATARNILNFIDGTNTTVVIDDSGGATRVRIDSASGGMGLLQTTDISPGPLVSYFTITNPSGPTTTLNLTANPRTNNDKQAFLMLPNLAALGVAGLSTASPAFAANVVNVVRVFVPYKFRFNRMAVRTTSVSSGGSLAIAIYEPDGSDKLVDTGAISIVLSPAATATTLVGTVSATTLYPGWYIMSWIVSTAQGFSGTAISNSAPNNADFIAEGTAGFVNGVGTPTATSAATNAFIVGTAGSATPSTLPDPLGVVTGKTGTTTVNILNVKLYNQ